MYIYIYYTMIKYIITYMNTHTHTHIHTHTHTHMYKYMYIHVKIVVMITDIGAEYGRGSARGAIAYMQIVYITNYIFENNSYDFIYRSRVWQRKRARSFRRYWRS